MFVLCCWIKIDFVELCSKCCFLWTISFHVADFLKEIYTPCLKCSNKVDWDLIYLIIIYLSHLFVSVLFICFNVIYLSQYHLFASILFICFIYLSHLFVLFNCLIHLSQQNPWTILCSKIKKTKTKIKTSDSLLKN